MFKGIPDHDLGYDVIFLDNVRLESSSEMPSVDLETNDNLIILNSPITEFEVKKHTLKMKAGKTISVDCIPNEVLNILYMYHQCGSVV